jgi:uncharacterized alkaline shock family protein YloU
MNSRINEQVENRFKELIGSIVKKALSRIDLVSLADMSLEKKAKESIIVKLVEDFVEIDVYINVKFGSLISEISCTLQEHIKNDVEAGTKFKVRKINIFVSSINL